MPRPAVAPSRLGAALAPAEGPNLWYARCGGATASTVAIRRDWLQEEFQRQGLRLSAVQEAKEREVRDSHFDHRIAGMFREGGNIPPIWAKAAGRDTVTLGITWVDEYQGILARPNGGIISPKHLRGRRLGLPHHEGSLVDWQRAMALRGFISALQVGGVGIDEVEFVDLPAPATDHQGRAARGSRVDPAQEALRNGTVDAIYAKGAWGVALEPALWQVIDLNTLPETNLRINNGTPRPITVGRSFLASHRELVVRYLSVLVRTGRWAVDHPEEVRVAIADEAGHDVPTIITAYGGDLHRHLIPTLAPEVVAGLDNQKNWLRDWGFLPQDFDLATWIDPTPLEEAEALVGRSDRGLAA